MTEDSDDEFGLLVITSIVISIVLPIVMECL
jgi:hypothetical protein